MEPFEKHQADVGELHAASSGLLADASQAGDNVSLTTHAYQPVIDDWQGLGAGEAQGAPQPLRAGADQASTSLAWAAVVTEFWAGKVETFNSEVDKIVERYESQGPRYGVTGDDPDDDEIEQARLDALAKAREQWWEAYNTHILDGEDQAAAMLADGPTEANLSVAKRFFDGMDWFTRNIGPAMPWIMSELFFGGRWAHHRWWTRHYLIWAQRYVDGRWAGGVPDAKGAARLVTTALRESGHGQRMRQMATWASRLSLVTAGGAAAGFQWYDDRNTGYTTEYRVARAGIAGGMTAGFAAAGGLLGAAAGAGLGPKGVVVGSVVGSTLGGIAGGWASDRAIDSLDYVIDHAAGSAPGSSGGVRDGAAAYVGAAAGNLTELSNLGRWAVPGSSGTPEADPTQVRDDVTNWLAGR
ncbi:hypothetical protein JQS43_03505 [Natronosporangium hydrolyticum]|uniref:Glycine zipper domain-containing protein n=1 Tax=Natronosporangium hydrolyticum TaxID=2811111 RepID=A0A895YCC2_9ACTN|nr:hypothetical protein [Natronosporangium hydrolyticum]QSB15437.1 hypothetical protein JQS43_03505 [Natronosporangium hydrolyticum]